MGKFDEHDEEVDDLDGGAEVEDKDEADGDADAEASAPAGASSAGGGAGEDSPDERTVASRQKLRDEMAAEIEVFLARGGEIAQIEPNVTADPPRKPDSDYGSRPI